MELSAYESVRYIDHNAPRLHSKILNNLCFLFLLGITVVPREIKDNGLCKILRANKAHYGLCENSELYIFYANVMCV